LKLFNLKNPIILIASAVFLLVVTAFVVWNGTQSKTLEKSLSELLVTPISLREDDTAARAAKTRLPGSHIKVFIPSLPYIYVSHAINGALIRPANNTQGWKYDLAESHTEQNISGQSIYTFKLRKGVKFQDGTPFNADSVAENFRFFAANPFVFSAINQFVANGWLKFNKVDDYTVQFILTKENGAFMNDLIWFEIYSHEYLITDTDPTTGKVVKVGWNGKATCPNLAFPGSYGIGPFVMKKGFVEGDRQTPVIELEANPNYWDPQYPKVEKVTIYTELPRKTAQEMVFYGKNPYSIPYLDGSQLDIATIDYAAKIEGMRSPLAKIITGPSNNNIAVQMNLRTDGVNANRVNNPLMKQEVRVALNKAIDQPKLIHFAYRGWGETSPAAVPGSYVGAKNSVRPWGETPMTEEEKSILSSTFVNSLSDSEKGSLDSLKQKWIAGTATLEDTKELHDLMARDRRLKILTQESFMWLWRGIETELERHGVVVDYYTVKDEKKVFGELLTTHNGQNQLDWDLLSWGDDDWYFNHAWSAILVQKTIDNVWSTIMDDPGLDGYIGEMFGTRQYINNAPNPKYEAVIEKIMQHVKQKAYMLFVPTPDLSMAVNKEVDFHPYKSGVLPLWEIGITPNHWSVNGDWQKNENLKQIYAISVFNKQ